MGRIVKVMNVNIVERDKQDIDSINKEQEIQSKNRLVAYGVHGGNSQHTRKNTTGIHVGSMRGISPREKKDKVNPSSPNFQAYIRGEISLKEMLRKEKLYWML